MPVRKIHGYRKGSTMAAHLRALLGEVRAFADVRHVFAARAVSATGDHDIPNEPPCFDQLDIGSCVLNSIVGCMAILLGAEGLPFTMLARLFLYWLCRLYQGDINEDGGTFVHLAVERLGTIGVCPESMWPYADSALLDAQGKAINPAPECFPAASDNRPTAWFAIPDGTGDDELAQLETAIRANHPVAFGSDVDSTIQSYQAGQVLTAPNPADIIGGHAMVVVGVRYINGQRLWRIRNSWGDWGDAGHAVADDAFMRQCTDRWVMTRMDPELF